MDTPILPLTLSSHGIRTSMRVTLMVSFLKRSTRAEAVIRSPVELPELLVSVVFCVMVVLFPSASTLLDSSVEL